MGSVALLNEVVRWSPAGKRIAYNQNFTLMTETPEEIKILLVIPFISPISPPTGIAIDGDLAFIAGYSGVIQCSLSNLTCIILISNTRSSYTGLSSIALMPEQNISSPLSS